MLDLHIGSLARRRASVSPLEVDIASQRLPVCSSDEKISGATTEEYLQRNTGERIGQSCPEIHSMTTIMFLRKKERR